MTVKVQWCSVAFNFIRLMYAKIKSVIKEQGSRKRESEQPDFCPMCRPSGRAKMGDSIKERQSGRQVTVRGMVGSLNEQPDSYPM